jgi:hypothetical protein
MKTLIITGDSLIVNGMSDAQFFLVSSQFFFVSSHFIFMVEFFYFFYSHVSFFSSHQNLLKYILLPLRNKRNRKAPKKMKWLKNEKNKIFALLKI